VSGSVVAVFGATGRTGRFVVSELVRRSMTPIAVGRDSLKLVECGFAERAIEVRRATVDDADSLDRAFEGVAAVINCAGPFLDTAHAVASAAMRAGVHYLDVTAEQASAQATLGTFDEAARRADVLVVPAMGFFGGLADLLVTAAMGSWDVADDVRIGIALDNWHPTLGTRRTGQRNTARRVVVSSGRLVAAPRPAVEMEWHFRAPFARQRVVQAPLSEVILIARHILTRELHTYLSRNALRDIQDPTTPPPTPADGWGRSAQRFRVEAHIRRGSRARRVAAQGRDIYASSAPLVCEAAQRILEGRARGTGSRAPGEIFDATALLEGTGLALEGIGD